MDSKAGDPAKAMFPGDDEATMAKRWMVGAILALGMLPAPSRAQVFSFGQKPQPKADSAFSNDVELPNPEFCPEHKKQPVAGPEFAPDRGVTPFVAIEEEDRNGFLDNRYPEPSPMLLWCKGEYLNWTVKDPNSSAILVTTSTKPDFTSNFGALDQNNTVVLLGAGPHPYGRAPGGRITGGFSPGFFFPIEVGGFWISRSIFQFQGVSNGGAGDPVLAIPFRDTSIPTSLPLNTLPIPVETATSGGFPGLTAGSITVEAKMNLWGLDSNLFLPLFGTEVFFCDGYAGYRHMELAEMLDIIKFLKPVADFVVIDFDGDPQGFGRGFVTVTEDRFQTRNSFNGGQLGVRTGLNFGRVGLLVDGKLGLGQNTQRLIVEGESRLLTPANNLRGESSQIHLPGGVLAVPSNIGTFTRNAFSVIPELDVNLGFQLFSSVRIFAGYSLLMWNNVIRPGDQLNTIIDGRQIPTDISYSQTFRAELPPSSFNITSFWAQGFNFGILIGF